MNVFFPTIDFLLLESCQLYIIAKYKDSNCCKKEAVIQRYLTKFTGKPLCQIKLQLKKRLWHRCFPEYCKILKNIFLYKTLLVTASGKIRTKSLKSAKFQFQVFLTTLDITGSLYIVTK